MKEAPIFLDFYTSPYYKTIAKTILIDPSKLEIKPYKAHKHALYTDKGIFKIQFYSPSWLFTDPRVATDYWNKNCGDVRTKRYKNLYKKYKTPLEKLFYIKKLINMHACYLIKL